MKPFLAALVAALALVGGLAQAQESPPSPPPPPPVAPWPPPPPPPPPSTVHRHLGFALRLDTGIGYMASRASDLDATMKGATLSFGFLIGGAVAENVILAGDVWFTGAVSPTFTLGGTAVTVPGNSSLDLGGIGLNFTYYFMPVNIYVSASPSITTVSVTEAGMSARTKEGFGMKIALGKEWWIGDHWGMGVAGQLFFSSNQDQGTNPPTWGTFAGAFAISATYN